MNFILHLPEIILNLNSKIILYVIRYLILALNDFVFIIDDYVVRNLAEFKKTFHTEVLAFFILN